MPTTGTDWFVQLLIFVPGRVPDRRRPRVPRVELLLPRVLGAARSPAVSRARRAVRHDLRSCAQRGRLHREHGALSGDASSTIPADKYEIIVIDDASTDRTAEILAGLQDEYPHLRVITIVKNRGKAHGFNVALAYANGDFILSNDADTKPNPDALWQYLSYFEREGGQNVGAVTGNMLAANRTTLTAQAQQNELNSIIGLIKRSQMSYGALFAFSGANTMYRKQAVLDVGGWHAEQPTEDIAIAWDMQAAGWRALFAPHIRFFLDVPEQLRALLKQRRRWSSGGIYVLVTKGPNLLRHPIRNFRMMPVVLDYSLSIVWSFLYWVSMILFVLTQVYFAATQNWERFWHNWYMVGIFVAIQMVVGLVQLTAASYYNDGGKTLEVHRVRAVVHARLLDGQHLDRRPRVHPHRPQGLDASRRRCVEVAGALRQPAGHPRGRSGTGAVMTTKPSYVIHEVDEKDVTVDWFFGSGHIGTKVAQLVLILVGWFFAVLPGGDHRLVPPEPATTTRGWWSYQEGFDMWDQTMRFLGILTVLLRRRVPGVAPRPSRHRSRSATGGRPTTSSVWRCGWRSPTPGTPTSSVPKPSACSSGRSRSSPTATSRPTSCAASTAPTGSTDATLAGRPSAHRRHEAA